MGLKAMQQLPREQLLHLLSVGFKQGLLWVALWRLPAAKELSGAQGAAAAADSFGGIGGAEAGGDGKCTS